MLDEHPEQKTDEELARIERVARIEREITYWFTVFAIAILWDLFMSESEWWYSIPIGVGSCLLAGRIAFGKGFLTGKKKG